MLPIITVKMSLIQEYAAFRRAITKDAEFVLSEAIKEQFRGLKPTPE